MRRALALAIVLAAAVAADPAAAAKPKPKQLPKCLSIADPTGDAGYGAPAATGDNALDLTKVVVSATKDSLVAKFGVVSLGDNPTKSWGDRFQLNFTWKSKTVEVYYKRSRTRAVEENVFYQQGIRVNGAFVSDQGITGKYDPAANVMTLAITLKALRSAAGSGIETGTIEAIEALALGSFVAQNFRWDSATATSKFTIRPCIG